VLAQPVAQFEQHPVAAQPLDADLLARTGEHDGQHGGDHDGAEDAQADLAEAEHERVVDDDGGDDAEQEGEAAYAQHQPAGEHGEHHRARREPGL
jgi:hypothetical protein